MFSEVQAQLWLVGQRATFVKVDAGVEWWRLPNGGWVGKRKVGNQYELRTFAPGSCNCG